MLSDVPTTITTSEGTIPEVATESLATSRRVGNGETIVIGGLIRKSDTTTVEKIPLLGNLPIVGPLFSNKIKNNDDKELLIFVTPTIVPEKPVAGNGIGVAP
jgi:type II secretory pathway component GspD/PulD (secretin)